MILGYFDERSAKETVVREKIGVLQQVKFDNYEINLEPVKPINLAKANKRIFGIRAHLLLIFERVNIVIK